VAHVLADWAGRLGRIERLCARDDLQALVVSSPINIKYLTGFSGSAGLLVAEPGAHCLVTDGRYEAQVKGWMRQGDMAAIAVSRVDSTYDAGLTDRVKHLKRVGFEAEHVTVATLRKWQALTPDTEWRATEDTVERLRLIKDDAELGALRRGGRALSGVAAALSEWVAEGRTERAIAKDIERALERAGFERPAFETIVASGPNSAFPHARPTDRRLAAGDLAVLDFGGVLDGYCVDLTRMAAVGAISPEARRLYDTVREAHGSALRAVRAGVSGADVDAAARQVLDAAGLGAAFVHGTGHGLGLEVHEGPRIARARSDTLEPGMVCTIEPGAYVEGIGGVRLEDDVIVMFEGAELLTDTPRDLVSVPAVRQSA
jgi:Xaa-Pro aminopeptidase